MGSVQYEIQRIDPPAYCKAVLLEVFNKGIQFFDTVNSIFDGRIVPGINGQWEWNKMLLRIQVIPFLCQVPL
jgi:hypothetical protein